MIYAIRTTTGREDIVIDIMESNIKAQSLPIKSVVHPAEIKGYVFAEGSSGAIHKAVLGLMHVRGIIEKPIELNEIKHFLELKKDRIKIEENDIVEIIGGPFRGEKGKITRVDAVKDEVTIELLDASIPIPVTIATEFIKILKRVSTTETPEKEEAKETEEKSYL
jgi:transcriptional antiterminator NusG